MADTWSVLEGKGDGFFGDISSLTIFADYRIPQVLVHLKAMKYSEDLMKKLREGLFLPYIVKYSYVFNLSIPRVKHWQSMDKEVD